MHHTYMTYTHVHVVHNMHTPTPTQHLPYTQTFAIEHVPTSLTNFHSLIHASKFNRLSQLLLLKSHQNTPGS